MFVLRFFIRISAFVSKEIAEILRQPRLILTLVLGPFLILLLFGIGYHNQARALRTVFVIPPGAEAQAMTDQIKQYASSLGPQLIFAGATTDENSARQALQLRQVDLVVLTPADPYQTVHNNQQATFTLLHNEIDPLQVDYVKYFGEVYVNEVNHRVLMAMAQQGQKDAGSAQEDVKQARANAAGLRAALQAGDQAAARQHQQALTNNVSALDLALGTTAGLLAGIQGGAGQPATTLPTTGSTSAASSQSQGSQDSVADLRSSLQTIHEDSSALSSAPGDANAQVQRAARLENDLARLDSELTDFRRIDPSVLVQPFRSDARGIATVQPALSDYFAPSVIALLLQHLAITFAALSIVREQQLGSMELFRVSPISALQMLLGKYVSYLVFGSLLAAILSLLLIYGLKVPLLGAPGWFALSLAALLFTALGVGFVISLASQSDSQAVQYAMILLLSSVFFSGFMLSLDNLIQPVRFISWILPATYGINLLQNIMLRGYFPNPYLLAALSAIGVGLFFVAWAMLARRMART